MLNGWFNDNFDMSLGAAMNRPGTYMYTSDGTEEQYQCPISGPTQWPVEAPHPVSSRFRAIRTIGTRPHVGMDIAVPRGTAVYPIAPGTVVKAGGGVVTVDHGGGYSSVYRHLSEINGVISFVGDPVDLEDVLGWSGGAEISICPLANIDPECWVC